MGHGRLSPLVKHLHRVKHVALTEQHDPQLLQVFVALEPNLCRGPTAARRRELRVHLVGIHERLKKRRQAKIARCLGKPVVTIAWYIRRAPPRSLQQDARAGRKHGHGHGHPHAGICSEAAAAQK
eukprot:scaffold13645_cov101-Isochrysis_galbana.AAC.1